MTMSCSIQIRTLTDKEQLVLSLERQYQDDVGVLAALFFNYVKLSPGEALYIGANEPHAYLSGECIEIMATSDNVVRAGLTPKYRDVQTLCSMLTYKQVSVIVTIVSHIQYISPFIFTCSISSLLGKYLSLVYYLPLSKCFRIQCAVKVLSMDHFSYDEPYKLVPSSYSLWC